MIKKLKQAVIASVLAASVMISAPATARDGYRDRDGGDDAAIAIGAGLVGLAIGAVIASDRGRDRHYDRGDYYYDGGYDRGGGYYNSYPRYRSYDRGHDRRWRNDRHDRRRYDDRRYRRGW